MTDTFNVNTISENETNNILVKSVAYDVNALKLFE